MPPCLFRLEGITKRVLILLFFGTVLGLASLSTNQPASQKVWSTPPRVLHYEQTIAIVRFNGPDSTVDGCKLILAEQNDQFDKLDLLARLGTKYATESVDFKTMMAIIDSCQRLQADETESEEDHEREEKEDIEYSKLFKGILPGTLWCGFDDVAPSYYSLGPLKSLDRCCRTHDHCPVKVKAFQNRYGVLNLHPYTKTHCECDEKFYNCLKSVGTDKADAVGKFFFNFIQIQCIKDEASACNRNDTARRTFNVRSLDRGCKEGISMVPVRTRKEY